jgi:hypothetical protein
MQHRSKRKTTRPPRCQAWHVKQQKKWRRQSRELSFCHRLPFDRSSLTHGYTASSPIRREMRRRAAVEPVIGHTKAEHRMGRDYLKGHDGDRINAVLTAAGYSFSLLLRWLERLLRVLIRMLRATCRGSRGPAECAGT